MYESLKEYARLMVQIATMLQHPSLSVDSSSYTRHLLSLIFNCKIASNEDLFGQRVHHHYHQITFIG